LRSHTRPAGLAVCLVAALGIFASTVSTKGPHFYPDDPIARVPESQDASKAQPYKMGDIYELAYNLLVTSGYKASGLRAKNLNTIDEVPDSSWFTNRIGQNKLTAEEIARGPVRGAPPDPSHWVLTREKTSGAHPGFTAKDAKGETWFLEFDPPYFPEGATGAVVVATKIFWAFGYNQVESFLTTFDPKLAEIDAKATIRRPNGKRTRFTRDDMNVVLEAVARRPDGSYRVVAGRQLPGKILGGFQYSGTRPDDPNDVVPHEHRRELRALRVFGAWANLTDLKAANTLDTVLPEIAQAYPGRRGARWTALRKALDRAAAQSSSLEARYAVLAHDLGSRSDVPAVAARARLRAADALSARLKVPASCRDAARLAARVLPQVGSIDGLAPGRILDVLLAADGLRRPERIDVLLEAHAAVAGVDTERVATRWRDALGVVRRVALRDVARAYPHADAIQKAVRAARLAALRRWKREAAR